MRDRLGDAGEYLTHPVSPTAPIRVVDPGFAVDQRGYVSISN